MKRRYVIPAAAVALHSASQAARASNADAWRMSVGSCANQTVAQPIWQSIVADRPDLHLFGGDNVYASEQPWSLAALQHDYALAARHEGMVAVPEEG